ncbi:MAG: hypothetical protein GTO45_08020 [Candidatus Aminicenantes bacterium]|nr:hypothetical protein [Candidatus Aminicenantes bacterium]NIM78777.1 hypothetical protein [Candidatus Aminicenantes bacterium]NIN18032.1 hypothetical protein [Candidatus Aminicenantes bacterium]NIN41932.1 hypothetical protein [Candidatus Aminicenantes bacterium]NIN84687.1 hypothetical protein [Candidatus Aminicenantes bacterium]
MRKLREFGIISDISLLSSYYAFMGTNAHSNNGANAGSNFNKMMKDIILNRCGNLEIDDNVNLGKEMDELEKNEPMMYYGIKRYRDHLMHSARIALLGEWLMGKKFNYTKRSTKRCYDCLNIKKCQNLRRQCTLGDAIEKLIPKLIVTSITDREKTAIPFNTSNEIFDYDKAFSYHVKKPNDENLLKKIWFITAVDHDIGYSFTYIRELFDSNSMLKNDEPPHTILAIKKELENVFDNLYDIIRTHATSIDTILHDTCFKKIPHGVIGAFHVRNLIEDEYILELAARSIARHDDDSRQICFHQEPLCFLLVLLDEIQEWGRPLKIAEEFGFDEIQSFSIKLFARCELPYIKYYREHKNRLDKIGTFVFELDYNISEEYLKQTGFSFPHFFYMKQLNLSRLMNGPAIKVRVRMPELAKEQLGEFKEKMYTKYRIAADWADRYLNNGGFVEFDISKSSDSECDFDKRPPNIWTLITEHCKAS